MLEKSIVEELKGIDMTQEEIMGLYLALLQIRFIALTYDFTENIEDELDSIIMKQVFYRHFEENAGKILEKTYEKLIEIFTKHPELKKANIRNRFIEIYEEEFSEEIRRIYLKFLKPWLMPDPWRRITKNILEKISRREYTLHDQTFMGTVSIWEGELINDVHTVQNLSLLEKYLLISNLCTFGYNVYLVFPFYIQESNIKKILDIPQLELALENLRSSSELIEGIRSVVSKLFTNIEVVQHDKGILRILHTVHNGKISISIADLKYFKDIDEIFRKIPNYDIAILVAENRDDVKKMENMYRYGRYNTFTIDMSTSLESGTLELLQILSKFLK